MIFYFSGTGNSRYVAEKIGESQGERLISIAKEMAMQKDIYEYELKGNEKIIFVHPVYAWSPPQMVTEFMEKIKFKNHQDNYVSAIAVCGENIGNTMKVINTTLAKNNLKVNSGFSLRTPNNYIIMGNVDSKEKEDEKLEALDISLKDINEIIYKNESGIFNIVKGPIPGFFTTVINPLFNKGAIDLKNFAVDDNCTGCGICEKVCNGRCIKVDEKPSWSGKCTQCLACIHYCPSKAIQYGKKTEKKGRYTNPNVKVTDMYID